MNRRIFCWRICFYYRDITHLNFYILILYTPVINFLSFTFLSSYYKFLKIRYMLHYITVNFHFSLQVLHVIYGISLSILLFCLSIQINGHFIINRYFSPFNRIFFMSQMFFRSFVFFLFFISMFIFLFIVITSKFRCV